MIQINRRAVEYRIDREALAEFVERQVDLVEAGSIPKLLADVVELRIQHESVSRDEMRALWLGAGLATPGTESGYWPVDHDHVTGAGPGAALQRLQRWPRTIW